MLKLITWNIQSARTPDGGADLDRVVACARELGDFDVLCLQEVAAGYRTRAGADCGNQFQGLAERLPDYAAVAGVATDTLHPGGGRRVLGNMIFSRYPVLQVFRHSLPWPADPTVMSMPRMALEATLDTPLGLLRVTTTHLEYFSPKQRLAQVDGLRQLHREAVRHARCERPGDPSAGPFFAVPRAGAALLAGDCNFLPASIEHAHMLAPFHDAIPAYRDAWQLAHPGLHHAPTVGLHDASPDASPPFTFDFVFVSDDLAGRVRDLTVDPVPGGSDHQAVLLELA
jgi:endonuclease/exonuclease/phosphatase family metal-dependent hydrolase